MALTDSKTNNAEDKNTRAVIPNNAIPINNAEA